MGVDQPGSDDMTGSVDHLGVDAGQGRCDPDDTAVLDEDVSLREVADLGIHRNDVTATNNDSLHCDCSLIETCPPCHMARRARVRMSHRGIAPSPTARIVTSCPP